MSNDQNNITRFPGQQNGGFTRPADLFGNLAVQTPDKKQRLQRMFEIAAEQKRNQVEDPEGYRVGEPVTHKKRVCKYCKCDVDDFTAGFFRDNNGTRFPCPECTPIVDRNKKRRELNEYIQALVKARKLTNLYNLPAEAPRLSFDLYPARGDKAAKKAVERFVGGGLKEILLFGGVGRGKSGLAISAVKALANQGAQVLFLPMTRYIALLQDNFQSGAEYNHIKEIAEGVDFLVIDDMGVERPTAFTLQETEALIDARHNKSLQTLITTNYTLDGLINYWFLTSGEKAGFQPAERAISRLSGWYRPVEFKGPDLRRAQ